jgi:protein-tyrosine phosphatase
MSWTQLPESGQVTGTERAARPFETLLIRLRHALTRSSRREPDPECPLRHSYWVEPGRLLAGGYPFSVDDVARLCRTVTFIVDLTEEHELEPYVEQLRGVRRVRMPIRDFSVPIDEEMVRILDLIDEALAHEEVVYVHCWGGRGRTGTVVGCHLVRHGMEPSEALARIARLRRRVPDRHVPSPEAAEQIAMVRRWRPGR